MLLAMLLPLPGCTGKTAQYLDSDVFERFTEYISKLDFAGAYKLLSQKSTTAPAPSGTMPSAAKVP